MALYRYIRITIIILINLLYMPAIISAQGLEDIIIEQYFVAEADNSYGDSITPGSVTYRIYVDMAPEYTLQAVYGDASHNLFIETTTSFFNTIGDGSKVGNRINARKINDFWTSVDSWITMNAATRNHVGLLLSDDKDGSIIKRDPFSEADGLTACKIPDVTYFELNTDIFNDNNEGSRFFTDNGAWAVLGGVQGPDENNRVLIAQLTTNGKLSFELNVQLGAPGGGTEKYVARDPQDPEIQSELLTYGH